MSVLIGASKNASVPSPLDIHLLRARELFQWLLTDYGELSDLSGHWENKMPRYFVMWRAGANYFNESRCALQGGEDKWPWVCWVTRVRGWCNSGWQIYLPVIYMPPTLPEGPRWHRILSLVGQRIYMDSESVIFSLLFLFISSLPIWSTIWCMWAVLSYIWYIAGWSILHWKVNCKFVWWTT